MSQWMVPNWDGDQQRRQDEEEEDEDNLNCNNRNVPMPKYESTQPLTWKNGQQKQEVHGGGELQLSPSTGQSDETLESIVRQMTTFNTNMQSENLNQHDWVGAGIGSIAAPSTGRCVRSSDKELTEAPFSRKRTRSHPECHQRGNTDSMYAEPDDFSIHAGAGATFCKDEDETLMTRAALESPESLKTDYSNEKPGDIKKKTDGCCSARRIRAATAPNQSERRRRDRLNKRLKDLQQLVPNGSKTDKASLLDDTIKYLQQLQAQVQLMSCIGTMPPMITHQQLLQMSLLAGRIGIGVGLPDSDSMARYVVQPIGQFLYPTNYAATARAFAPPAVLLPPIAPRTQSRTKTSTVPQMADPFCSIFAQPSMDMDLYSKMVTLYCQEVSKTPRRTSTSPLQSHRVNQGVMENMG